MLSEKKIPKTSTPLANGWRSPLGLSWRAYRCASSRKALQDKPMGSNTLQNRVRVSASLLDISPSDFIGEGTGVPGDPNWVGANRHYHFEGADAEANSAEKAVRRRVPAGPVRPFIGVVERKPEALGSFDHNRLVLTDRRGKFVADQGNERS